MCVLLRRTVARRVISFMPSRVFPNTSDGRALSRSPEMIPELALRVARNSSVSSEADEERSRR